MQQQKTFETLRKFLRGGDANRPVDLSDLPSDETGGRHEVDPHIRRDLDRVFVSQDETLGILRDCAVMLLAASAMIAIVWSLSPELGGL